jgi:hypothetical protein
MSPVEVNGVDNKAHAITAAESIGELRKTLRQLKATKLRELHNTIAVEKGQQLLDQLERWADNPCICQALIEAYWDWRSQVDRILARRS